MRSDRERLLDILEAIERIEAHKNGSREAFNDDELLQVWFLHYLQIIGEAASRLSPELRSRYPETPWGQMIGMRHILVHGYFEVDIDIVWNAAQFNLEELKIQIEQILQQLNQIE